MSEIYGDRESVAGEIGSALGLTGGAPQTVVDVIRRNAKCYAGLLGTFRAGHKGYADNFESPKMYPGRLAAAARWGAPTGDEIDAKPWLEGLPRLIFISDMALAWARSMKPSSALTSRPGSCSRSELARTGAARETSLSPMV